MIRIKIRKELSCRIHLERILTYLDIIPEDVYGTIKPSPFNTTTTNSIIRILIILSLPHTSICAESFLQKLTVSTLFYDTTTVHYKDLITVLDR